MKPLRLSDEAIGRRSRPTGRWPEISNFRAMVCLAALLSSLMESNR